MSPRVVTGGHRIICNGNHRGRRCQRAVLWRVGQRFFCAPHFDEHLEQNWDALDKYEIERLSDNEKDFDQYSNVGASEPLCQVPRPRPDAEPTHEREEETRVCH